MSVLIGFNTLNFSNRWNGKFFRNEIPFGKTALPTIATFKGAIAVAFVGVLTSLSYNLYRIPRVDKKTTSVLSVENTYGNSEQYTGLLISATGQTTRFVLRGLKPDSVKSDITDFLQNWGSIGTGISFDVQYGVQGRQHV